MGYVIGIDGGGTKTTGVIADEKGRTIAEATVGASNPNIVSATDLKATFSKLKGQLQQKNKAAFEKVDRLFAGIPGTGHPSARQTVHQALSETMPSTMSMTVDNDAIIALYSGTLGQPGIVQISGTGSITYGINHDGVRNRVGGWGHFIGEQGSGFGLGSDALQAAFAAHDQAGPATMLEESIRHFFKKQSLPDIIPEIYQATSPKETIASLGRLVMEAVDQKDIIATEFIQQNGLYIGQSVSALMKKLFKKGDIPVVLAGGLFNRVDLFRSAIEAGLGNYSDSTRLIIPDKPPVNGAVSAALMMDTSL